MRHIRLVWQATRGLLLGVLLITVLLPPNFLRAADRIELKSDLVGTYRCEGLNGNGQPYGGIVEIQKRDRLFHLRWTFMTPDGPLHVYGLGLVNNGRLAVTVFAFDQQGRVTVPPTVAVYAIEKAKPFTLKAEWASIDGPSVNSETLTKLPQGEHPTLPAPKKTPAPQTYGA